MVERRRRVQPIYPKDLGAIVVRADLYPGAFVVEAGTCTGALTMAALRAVGSEGRVVSYEIREEFLAEARAAIEDTLGSFPENLELRLGDVGRDMAERDVDRLLLDLPEPWEAVTVAAASLNTG